jgi:hypothetical protein
MRLRRKLLELLGRAIAAARGKDRPGDVDALRRARAQLVKAPLPYTRTTRNGQVIDQLTNYAMYAAERRLGYDQGSLDVIQGSYKAGDGAPQSAGTHDGGGVVDLTENDWSAKVHALRAVGFAAWHRPQNWDGRGGMGHIHAVLIGNVKLAPEAKAQVEAYRAHRIGLANNAADPTWHPDPIPTFRMPIYRTENPS